MKIIKDYNNVSKELRPVPLKRGETAVYKLLNGRPDPSRKDNLGNPVISYGKAVRIPTSDRIWDPFYKDESGDTVGRYVDIGVVKEFTADIVTRTVAFYATNGGDYINDGYIRLSGDNNQDAEMYEFFEMSNQNKSFKYRDPSVEPLFERYRVEEENNKRVKVISKKADALNLAVNMSLTEMRDFCAQMNWNELADEDVIKSSVLTFAEKEPVNFLKLISDPSSTTKALVKQAMTSDIIRYDPSQHRIVWSKGEVTIATLDRVDGKNQVDLFADWLSTAKNGSTIQGKIKSMLNGKRREALGAKEGEE